ncbi:MAG: hypothetical protein M3322_07660 [Actinomycetota bacterium]|nr:hypothetical protein [Actinomycetota bacterium]
MSEQERERIAREPEEADVEAHRGTYVRGEGEAPEGAGERSEESDEPDADVEGHGFKRV